MRDKSSAYLMETESQSRSVVSDSLRPHGLYSPWNSPGQNSGVGSLSLLQGIFPTQVSLTAGRFFTCEPRGEALPCRGARTIQWSNACVTALRLTSDFESLVLYKPSVRRAIIFIMQDLCMYHLQYFEKKI